MCKVALKSKVKEGKQKISTEMTLEKYLDHPPHSKRKLNQVVGEGIPPMW